MNVQNRGIEVQEPRARRRLAVRLLWFVAIGLLVSAIGTSFLLDLDPAVRAATRPWCPSGTEAVAVQHARTEGFAGYHLELACVGADRDTPISVWPAMATLVAACFLAWVVFAALVVLLAPPLLRRWYRRSGAPVSGA